MNNKAIYINFLKLKKKEIKTNGKIHLLLLKNNVK